MANRVLLLALSAVLAFGAGVALAPVFRWSSATSAPLSAASSQASSAHPEELTLLLRELRQALEILTDAVRGRPGELVPPATEASSRRTPEEVGGRVESTELAVSLQSLADAIRDLRSESGAAATRPEELVKPAFVDRERAFAATGMEQAAAAGEQALEKARAALNQSHMFLTNQTVLSRYGLPDYRAFDGSNESWTYALTRETGNISFKFLFHGGTVFGSQFND